MHRVAILALAWLPAVAAGCKRPSPAPVKAVASPEDSSDGWTAYADSEFAVAVPPRLKVNNDVATPGFAIALKTGMGSTGEAVFMRYDSRADLLVRDAAEFELRDYIAGGGKALASVRRVAMKSGDCAAFSAVSSGRDCATSAPGRCNQHHFLAYCDGPDKKRYIFIGDLGATDSVDRRPPGFAENAAAFERVLRSIEFKAAKS